jgi:DNA-binding transcriptional regulator YhcF (GntR family)
MNYSSHHSIFIQRADRICDRVLNGSYAPDSRIPSVRELATEMEVNPNTVMRSFERLQNHEIIYNKRGVGYFISPDAKQKIHDLRHFHFIDEILPSVFKEMLLLGIGPDELTQAYQTYVSTHKNKTKQDETK